MSFFQLKFFVFLFLIFTPLGGCTGITPDDPIEPGYGDGAALDKQLNEKRKTIWGGAGLSLFGDEPESGSGSIGVNAFLWRASLDTISFMPVNSADPFGGVIITDWHSSTTAPNERFKLNLYILGRALRADGIRVSVFRQVFTRSGSWADAPVPADTKTKIEDSILTRARQLRNSALMQRKK